MAGAGTCRVGHVACLRAGKAGGALQAKPARLFSNIGEGQMRQGNGLLGNRIATLLGVWAFAFTFLAFGSEQATLLPTGSIVLAASGGLAGLTKAIRKVLSGSCAQTIEPSAKNTRTSRRRTL